MTTPRVSDARAPCDLGRRLRRRRARSVRLGRRPGLLRAFNEAGVLSAADVHVAVAAGRARRRARRGGAPRGGAGRARPRARPRARRPGDDRRRRRASRPTTRSTWPRCRGRTRPAGWSGWPRASLVAVGDGDGGGSGDESRPLRLVGTRLYLDRYWREERQVAARPACAGRAEPRGRPASTCSATGCARLFAGEPDGRQRAGGGVGGAAGPDGRRRRPGDRQDDDGRADRRPARRAGRGRRDAAAAGRAGGADRQGRGAAARRPSTRRPATCRSPRRSASQLLGAARRRRCTGCSAGGPDSHSRFRHDRRNRLAARRRDRRRDLDGVAVADGAAGRGGPRRTPAWSSSATPDQLASVEAGAVLGDIVGPAADGRELSGAARARSGRARRSARRAARRRGHRRRDRRARPRAPLRRRDRALAEAIRGATPTRGRAARDRRTASWIAVDVAERDAGARRRSRRAARWRPARPRRRGRPGRRCARGARRRSAAFRILCAHRRGPQGVATWTARIEGWLADEVDGFAAIERWYAGRPLLVTENDYELAALQRRHRRRRRPRPGPAGRGLRARR